MITLTIKKKYVCYVAQYLIKAMNSEFFYVLESLRSQVKEYPNATLETEIVINLDYSVIMPLFNGLGNMPEGITSRMHRGLKAVIAPHIMSWLPLLEVNLENVSQEDLPKYQIALEFTHREEAINKYEEDEVEAGLVVLER